MSNNQKQAQMTTVSLIEQAEKCLMVDNTQAAIALALVAIAKSMNNIDSHVESLDRYGIAVLSP